MISCTLQVQVRIAQLHYKKGTSNNKGTQEPSAALASSLYVEAELCAYGRRLGLPQRTPFVACTQQGCVWDSTLTFPTKVQTTAPCDNMYWNCLNILVTQLSIIEVRQQSITSAMYMTSTIHFFIA